jgi:hypothetical protein
LTFDFALAWIAHRVWRLPEKRVICYTEYSK